MSSRCDTFPGDDDPKHWHRLTSEGCLHLVERLVNLHPQLHELREDINRCDRDMAKAAADHTHQPLSMAILDVHAVGKTAFTRFWLDSAKKEAPKVETSHPFPYLSLSVPSSTTLKHHIVNNLFEERRFLLW
jgi:hypothetical protein